MLSLSRPGGGDLFHEGTVLLVGHPVPNQPESVIAADERLDIVAVWAGALEFPDVFHSPLP